MVTHKRRKAQLLLGSTPGRVPRKPRGHSGGGSPFLGCTFLGAARGSQAWLQGSQMKKLRSRKGAKGTPGQAPLPSTRCRVSTACVLPALNLCSRLGLPI